MPLGDFLEDANHFIIDLNWLGCTAKYRTWAKIPILAIRTWS